MSSSPTTQQKKTMRRKTVASLSSSSSSNSSTATHPRRLHSNPSLSSASSPPLLHPDDLTLGLSLTNEKQTTLYVKVMMEGIPIGRKLDLRAHDGYRHLISTLQLMFTTTILWAEEDGLMDSSEKCHVLTYEDKEGDWMMLGDVPWEMFLTTVKRLKITRIDKRCLC